MILEIQEIREGQEIPLKNIAFIAELKNDAMDVLAEHGIQRIVPFFQKDPS